MSMSIAAVFSVQINKGAFVACDVLHRRWASGPPAQPHLTSISDGASPLSRLPHSRGCPRPHNASPESFEIMTSNDDIPDDEDRNDVDEPSAKRRRNFIARNVGEGISPVLEHTAEDPNRLAKHAGRRSLGATRARHVVSAKVSISNVYMLREEASSMCLLDAVGMTANHDQTRDIPQCHHVRHQTDGDED